MTSWTKTEDTTTTWTDVDDVTTVWTDTADASTTWFEVFRFYQLVAAGKNLITASGKTLVIPQQSKFSE